MVYIIEKAFAYWVFLDDFSLHTRQSQTLKNQRNNIMSADNAHPNQPRNQRKNKQQNRTAAKSARSSAPRKSMNPQENRSEQQRGRQQKNRK